MPPNPAGTDRCDLLHPLLIKQTFNDIIQWIKKGKRMRAPYQVLVIPYRRVDTKLEYAIFSRSDMACWQWIAGGGEEFDMSILDSARREANEEANVSLDSKFIQLDSRTTIPVVNVGGKFLWGDDIFVIDEYSFGVFIDGEDLSISREHKEFRWVSYDEAIQVLKYDSNKSALWELDTRLNREDLI